MIGVRHLVVKDVKKKRRFGVKKKTKNHLFNENFLFPFFDFMDEKN